MQRLYFVKIENLEEKRRGWNKKLLNGEKKGVIEVSIFHHFHTNLVGCEGKGMNMKEYVVFISQINKSFQHGKFWKEQRTIKY